MDASSRYGVFLRPDPRTCAAVTTVTGQLRAQYGLRSAAAFPPHATLAGSLPLAGSPEELMDALAAALRRFSAFDVENGGVCRLGEGAIIYDIHHLEGAPNGSLIELAETVDAAVRPLLAPHVTGVPADTYQAGSWRGHLSLASHDLLDRPDLRDETEDYIRGLDVAYPARFTADTIAVYRLTHASWSGRWWEAMRWEHLRSIHLPSGRGHAGSPTNLKPVSTPRARS